MTKSMAQMVLDVRTLFKKEKQERRLSIGISDELKRTTAATNIGRNIVSKIRTQDDVDTWHIEDNYVEERNRELSVPAHFASLVRAVVHTMFFGEKNKCRQLTRFSNKSIKFTQKGLLLGERIAIASGCGAVLLCTNS